MKIQRHPGPFVGYDAELARAAAMSVIEWYGNDSPITHQRILKNGIWNDHVAVQSALAAIYHLRTVREALSLAANIIMSFEPGDSRAVSNEAVAIAAVASGDTSNEVMAVIRSSRFE